MLFVSSVDVVPKDTIAGLVLPSSCVVVAPRGARPVVMFVSVVAICKRRRKASSASEEAGAGDDDEGSTASETAGVVLVFPCVPSRSRFLLEVLVTTLEPEDVPLPAQKLLCATCGPSSAPKLSHKQFNAGFGNSRSTVAEANALSSATVAGTVATTSSTPQLL